jgi:hypothetical protein
MIYLDLRRASEQAHPLFREEARQAARNLAEHPIAASFFDSVATAASREIDRHGDRFDGLPIMIHWNLDDVPADVADHELNFLIGAVTIARDVARRAYASILPQPWNEILFQLAELRDQRAAERRWLRRLYTGGHVAAVEGPELDDAA